MNKIGFGRQFPRSRNTFIFRGVSKVIGGVHEKPRFRHAVPQEPQNSIFSRDVSKVIRAGHEQTWFRQAFPQERLNSYFY